MPPATWKVSLSTSRVHVECHQPPISTAQLANAKVVAVPPYFPISGGVRTSGSIGSRSSTGGRSPLATSAASIGDSLYLDSPIVVVVVAAASSVPPAHAVTLDSTSTTRKGTNIRLIKLFLST